MVTDRNDSTTQLNLAPASDQDHRAILPEYLTPSQAAQLTSFTPKALEALRARRCGPRYFKIGRSVRYRASDLRAWIEGARND